MTVTTYRAKFTDQSGKKYHGAVFADKYHPKSFQAHLCPHITELEVDYPEWTAKGANSRDGMESLVRKMKAKAKKMGLGLISEGETRYAPATARVAETPQSERAAIVAELQIDLSPPELK